MIAGKIQTINTLEVNNLGELNKALNTWNIEQKKEFKTLFVFAQALGIKNIEMSFNLESNRAQLIFNTTIKK
jgi:hypothetical protein